MHLIFKAGCVTVSQPDMLQVAMALCAAIKIAGD